MRALALLVVLVTVLAGCSWSDTEPGLFRQSANGQTTTPEPPEPTNPQLPVAGETTWTSAEGEQVTTRIAVHAVRRGDHLTVLDWSITPLSAPGLRSGDEVPPAFDLGLDRSAAGGVNIVLLDPRTDTVYRPLSHQSRQQGHRCLCTPVRAAQATLRLGETRLLQVAYPPLPARVRFVDVVAATVPPFTHVPVSAEGWAPTATTPADLIRPAEPPEPLTAPQYFQVDDGTDSRGSASLRVDQVLAGPDSTTVRWTLRSMAGQPAFLAVPLGPPLVAVSPPKRTNRDAPLMSTNAASGPTLAVPGGIAMPARWMTGTDAGRPYLECLCTNLDFWAIGLRDSGGAAQLVTTYPALPRGTDRVDVVLPGVAILPGLTVSAAADGATRVGPPTRTAHQATWIYFVKRPPIGWSSGEWPTPLPDPAQLKDYDVSIDRLTAPTG